ncbi:MAG: UDP-N-acetylmuramoyl-L-alanine--D-glutamate ligase [Chromatiales bacterium]|nr:UDP-N-acetylmuramoyl-L-alanine--D-glutamate ligase [Chromatiales bacterium]
MAAARTDATTPPASRAGGVALVLGMGSTGVSCARFLAGRGARAIFADTRALPPGMAAIRAAMPGAEVLAGGPPATVPAGVDRVLVSPGVDLRLPVLADARQRGIPVLSDIDLFVAEAAAPITAITGSNGKSTVTSMVGAMLAGAGVPAAVGGNLGTPALELLAPGVRHYVLELSSFQLERSGPVPTASAVVLNITPDHLDIHGDMAAYAAAKSRIYARCGLAVVNRDLPELAALVPPGTPLVGFGLGAPAGQDFGVLERRDGHWLARGTDPLLPVAELPVTGRHNVSNALAALALCSATGVGLHDLLPGLRGYRPLPHRMALVARRNGVAWIDDSKATNVGSAATSIGGVAGPLVLIAGGDGKGASFEAIAAALRGRESAAVLLGRDRELLAAALAGVCPVHLVADMRAAVSKAAELARPGWTVLLAPACSSLDMFRDYAARGMAFSAAVAALPGGDA